MKKNSIDPNRLSNEQKEIMLRRKKRRQLQKKRQRRNRRLALLVIVILLLTFAFRSCSKRNKAKKEAENKTKTTQQSSSSKTKKKQKDNSTGNEEENITTGILSIGSHEINVVNPEIIEGSFDAETMTDKQTVYKVDSSTALDEILSYLEDHLENERGSEYQLDDILEEYIRIELSSEYYLEVRNDTKTEVRGMEEEATPVYLYAKKKGSNVADLQNVYYTTASIKSDIISLLDSNEIKGQTHELEEE